MSENWDELVKKISAEYNPPPEPARDAMWAEIEARMSQAASQPPGGEGVGGEVISLDQARRKRASFNGWMGGAAAAAILVLGLGLGRWSAARDAPVAGAPAGTAPALASSGGETEDNDGVFRLAALEHFSETGAFLTRLQTEAEGGATEDGVAKWARGLLTDTRLLLDSPAGNDPQIRALLEDLELVLMQVVSLPEPPAEASERQRELEYLAEGLDENRVLPRIQEVVPAMAGLGT